MFHRSHRLFLRPPFPEDRAAIIGVLGDEARAEAMVHGKPGRHFVLALPGSQGAPVVGAASFVEGEAGLEICVKIDGAHEGEGFGAEAARALSEIAVAVGYGELPRRFASPSNGRQFDCQDIQPSVWLNGSAAQLALPKAAA
jgi:RimJ/RimL family protein N-acetyltransferase